MYYNIKTLGEFETEDDRVWIKYYFQSDDSYTVYAYAEEKALLPSGYRIGDYPVTCKEEADKILEKILSKFFGKKKYCN